jgi:hypothetical protein
MSQLAAHAGGRTTIHLVFTKPAGADETWAQTDLWDRGRQIPAAISTIDDNGAEADQFGARTSGEAFLYGIDGQLLFHGGITAGRGHEGISSGRVALTALLDGKSANQAQSPVFGCALLNSSCPTQ